MTLDAPRPAGGMLLGRVRGVPVLLAPSWWVGAVVITALYAPLVTTLVPDVRDGTAVLLAAALAVLLGVSVLLHELGHCAAALRLGVGVLRIRLYLLGGYSELSRRPAGPRDEALIAAAGPAVSVLIAASAGAAWWLLPPGDPLWLLVAQLAVTNAAVAAVNLLPGLPLDGGRLVRALTWGLTGNRGAGTTAATVGACVVAVALVTWGVSGLATGTPDGWLRAAVCGLLAWFVVSGAGAESAAERAARWPAGVDPAQLVRPVLQLPAETPVADALAAAAGRGVVLVGVDGVAIGLLDAHRAQRIAATAPLAPAERAAERLRPESVVPASDTGEQLLERIRGASGQQFLVVDAAARPTGVLHRDDVSRAVARHRAA